MDDPFNLQRFLDAQLGTYESALSELRSGAKRGHWMWFIFPQLADLGRSAAAKFYGIRSLQEARAYHEHPLLRSRLIDCVEALMPFAGSRTAEEILGPIDAVKLKSSLTLFDIVKPDATFAAGLAAFCEGERDALTLALLNSTR